MQMSKRVIFSNATANDQGGVVPNECLDLSRYVTNPVILNDHNWSSDSIDKPFANLLGTATDIKLENGNWTCVPVFHELTEESKIAKNLYESGVLKAVSIGGEAIWKTTETQDNYGNPILAQNEAGNKICEKFVLYEISLVVLPSNPDAIQLGSNKFYTKEMLETATANITKLHTNLINYKPIINNQNTNVMKKTEAELKALQDTRANEIKTLNLENFCSKFELENLSSLENYDEFKANKEKLKKDADKLAADKDRKTGIPFLDDILRLKAVVAVIDELKTIFGAPAITVDKDSKVMNPDTTRELPIGLKTKLADAEKSFKESTEKAEALCDNYTRAKEAYEAEESEEAKTRMETAKKEAEKAIKVAEAAEKVYNEVKAEAEEAKKSKKEPDDSGDDDMEKEKVKNASNSEGKKPQRKTPEQLKTAIDNGKLKLATLPKLIYKMPKAHNLTLSQLRSEANKTQLSNEGKVYNRVCGSYDGTPEISDFIALGQAILNESRLNRRVYHGSKLMNPSVIDNIRFFQNLSGGQYEAFKKDVNIRGGETSLHAIMERLTLGTSEYFDYSVKSFKSMSQLAANPTDTFLNNPDTLAIQFLPLAIFNLFPDESWDSEIPMFGVSDTGNNRGIVWTNIDANPGIYRGTQPSPSDYTYTDTAVSLQLVGYWLQPMNFNPYTMHQLRYEQMVTGWAQAFMKLYATIGDDLIYTLASLVPANAYINTTGSSFAVSSSMNAFYPLWYTFAGTLAAPSLADITQEEQIFIMQNFLIDKQSPSVLFDGVGYSRLLNDKEVTNKLTEWKDVGSGKFLGYLNSKFYTRQRTAIYDQATGNILDLNGSIPDTAVSANLAYIPSQIGKGIGMIDVFMLQDPRSYGYVMSADLRIGINALRAAKQGLALLNYGSPSI